MSCLRVSHQETNAVRDTGGMPWYGLRTKSNREKIAATILESKGYVPYLPLYRVQRRWSDRVVESSVPLFSGYVFCRFDVSKRLPVITTPGVVSVVSYGQNPAPIADSEIEAIKGVLQSGFASEPCPFLREGQRVRVCEGPLKDVEGILLKKKSQWKLVVSVTMLQRALSVEVDPDCVRPV